MPNQPKNIAIFASGQGSNTEQIINYFKSSSSVKIALIATNNADSKVLDIAAKHQIPSIIFSKNALNKHVDNMIVRLLEAQQIDLIALAGFLWLLPENIIQKYPSKIINIHPALLPDFGGKGMYGDNVHQAVYNSKADETGITIHYVDEAFDNGKIIFQKTVDLASDDTPNSIANKVRSLEHIYYPKVIEQVLTKGA